MLTDLRSIIDVQSSSAQVRSISPTDFGDDYDYDDDDDGIETETGIQWKDKGKGKAEIALNGHGPDSVILPEVPGDMGQQWCDPSVEW